MSKNIQKTGQDRSRPVMNWFWFEPVQTGLVTAKNWKRPVYTGPVQFFGSLGTLRTGLSLGLRHLRQKTETGPDFQTLLRKQKSLYWPVPPITVVHHNK